MVKLIDKSESATSYYLLLELCNGGDLQGLRELRGGYLPEKEARVILQQLVRGMCALKEQNVVHRDLKLENVMLNFSSFPDYFGITAQGGNANFDLK